MTKQKTPNLEFPPDQFETLRVLIIQALDSKCDCVSCKGLIILSKRIVSYNDKRSNYTR